MDRLNKKVQNHQAQQLAGRDFISLSLSLSNIYIYIYIMSPSSLNVQNLLQVLQQFQHSDQSRHAINSLGSPLCADRMIHAAVTRSTKQHVLLAL